MIQASQIKPLKAKILVRKYERPEQTPSGLYLNPAWLQDNSRSLWEPVAYGPDAFRGMGLENFPCNPFECLLVTDKDSGVFWGEVEGKEHYFLEAKQVVKIIPYEEGGDDE